MVEKADNSYQEVKHDSVAHNLAEDFSTSGLLVVRGVNIPFEDIYYTYTRVGGSNNHHPMGTIRHKDKEVLNKALVENGSPRTTPVNLIKGS